MRLTIYWMFPISAVRIEFRLLEAEEVTVLRKGKKEEFTVIAVVLFLFLIGKLDLTKIFTIASSLVVAGIGFMDDHRHIAARWRFFMHTIAALSVLFFISGFPPVMIGIY